MSDYDNEEHEIGITEFNEDERRINLSSSDKLDSITILIEDYIERFIPTLEEEKQEEDDDSGKAENERFRFLKEYFAGALIQRCLYHALETLMLIKGIKTHYEAWVLFRDLYDEDFKQQEEIAAKLDSDPNCPYKRDGSLKEPNEEAAQVLKDSEAGIDIIEADNMDESAKV